VKRAIRIVEHTPTQLVVGSESYGPRLGDVVSILVGIATIALIHPQSAISLTVGAVFVLSGLAGLRRSYEVTARFDREAQVLRVRNDSLRIPLGDVTGLRLVRLSGEGAEAEAFVEVRTGDVLPLGVVDSPEAPALKQIQQFLQLPDVAQTDLHTITGLKGFVLRTCIMWGVSPRRLSGLITARTRSHAEVPLAGEGCAYCRAQSPLDGAFCRRCGAFLLNPGLGVRASFGRRALAAVTGPLLLAAIVAAVWFAAAPSPNGGARIEGVGAWLLLLSLVSYVVLWCSGSSPGKLLLGLQVVLHQSGRRPGALRMIGRELPGKALSAVLFGFGFVAAAKDSDGRALHDRLFGTVVVARRPTIRPARALGVESGAPGRSER
jgi:uncharacterized RDD family membrane protein YckC